jgi:hypothetical protein
MFDFLRAINIIKTTSFGGEVKPSVPCRKILRYAKKNPREYERDISSKKFTAISNQVYPDLLLGVSAFICQRDLVNEPGMIRTEMGTHNKPQNGSSAWESLYDTTP